VFETLYKGESVRDRDFDDMAPDDIRRFLTCEVHAPPLHQSFMSDMWRCPRFFLFRDRLGLVPKFSPPCAANLGTFFHAAMESFGVTRETSLPLDVVASAVASVHEKCLLMQEEITQHYTALKHPDLAIPHCEECNRLADMAVTLATVFAMQCRLDPDRYSPVAVERDIEIQVPEIHHTIKMKLDLIIYDKQAKCLLIVDYKTVSSKYTLDEYASGYGYDFQLRTYRYGASRDLTENPLPIPGVNGTTADFPVGGALVGALRKPTIRAKKGQEPKDFLDEVTDYYAGRPDSRPQPKQATKGGNPAFDEEDKPVYVLDKETGQPKLYTRWDHTDKLAQWMQSPPMGYIPVWFREPEFPDELILLTRLAAKAMHSTPTLSNFPRFGKLTGQCSNMFNRVCPYAELCSNQCGHWQGIVDNGFNTGVIHGEDSPALEEN